MTGLLEGKCAVITGAGSGVGQASSLRFAAEGARVVCADIDVDRAKQTVQQIEAAGGVAFAAHADVSREDHVVEMIEAAAAQFGKVDIVFNNAGVPTPRRGMAIEDHTLEDFQRLVAINFGGVFFGCKHAVLQFKKQGGPGVVLNTGSVAGIVAWGGSVYGAIKSAVHQLTRAVAIEGAPFGIRANAICPAAMPATNFSVAGGMDPALRDDPAALRTIAAVHPLGRPITAQDCAEAAVYLVSDRAANVTGVLLPIDGGYVAR
jgi:NAD(P)-dependent dehydrogenase (short-subunit alcohol dehydrogenase family)